MMLSDFYSIASYGTGHTEIGIVASVPMASFAQEKYSH